MRIEIPDEEVAAAAGVPAVVEDLAALHGGIDALEQMHAQQDDRLNAHVAAFEKLVTRVVALLGDLTARVQALEAVAPTEPPVVVPPVPPVEPPPSPPMTVFLDIFDQTDFYQMGPRGAHWDNPANTVRSFVDPVARRAVFDFPAVPLGGTANIERRFTLNEQLTDFGIEMGLVLPTNFRVRQNRNPVTGANLPSNGKVVRAFTEDYEDRSKWGASWWPPTEAGTLARVMLDQGAPGPQGGVGPRPGSGVFTVLPEHRGREMVLTFRCRASLDRLELYVDGVLVSTALGIINGGSGYWSHGYVLGAQNAGWDEATWIEMTRFEVRTL